MEMLMSQRTNERTQTVMDTNNADNYFLNLS